MSITDELRKVAAKTECANGRCEKLYRGDLERIADRIDAEHQKALDEWKAEHGQTWLRGYGECHAELMEGNEVIAADLERAGWVRLPLDADGEYIHAGDVLDGYGKTIEVVEMRYGRSGWVLISRDGNGYADTFAFSHHHALTVEDVLTEFAAKLMERGELTNGGAQTIAEYAKRLTLAGDAE